MLAVVAIVTTVISLVRHTHGQLGGGEQEGLGREQCVELPNCEPKRPK